MTDIEQKKIFAKNLRYYVAQSGKSQKEIAKDLNFSEKTFNGWCREIAMPTMGKIQAIADYFHIGKTDLVDNKNSSSSRSITTDEAGLLTDYRKLNDKGKEKVREYANDLTDQKKYTEDGPAASDGLKGEAG